MGRRRGSKASSVRVDVQPDPEDKAEGNDITADHNSEQSVSDIPYASDNIATPRDVDGPQGNLDGVVDEQVLQRTLM